MCANMPGRWSLSTWAQVCHGVLDEVLQAVTHYQRPEQGVMASQVAHPCGGRAGVVRKEELGRLLVVIGSAWLEIVECDVLRVVELGS